MSQPNTQTILNQMTVVGTNYINAESALIGAMMGKPALFPTVMGKVASDEFFILRNRWIWSALEHLQATNTAINLITVATELRKRNQLEELGGETYLIGMLKSAHIPDDAPAFARLVKEAAIRRALQANADEIRKLATEETTPIETVLEKAGELLQQTQTRLTPDNPTLVQIFHQHMTHFDTAQNNPNTHGIPSGISKLDETTGGFRRGRRYDVGARTHQGKTSFMLTCALNATRAGARVLFVTLEETLQDLMSRFIGMDANIAPDRLTTGQVTPDEVLRYGEVCGRLCKLPFEPLATTRLTPRKLFSEIHQRVQERGLDIVFVDYLSRLSAGEHPYKTETDRLNYVSEALKDIALSKALNIALVVGVQNNRESEKNGHRHPELTDFKGSGNIEQDTDVALLLYREGFYKKDVAFPEKAEIIVAKNKVNGKLDTVYTHFNLTSTRYSDWHGV